MTVEELTENVGTGVFEIHWRSGGFSIGAIGCAVNGLKWVAPCNWVSPMEPSARNYAEHVEKIDRLVPIPLPNDPRNLE